MVSKEGFFIGVLARLSWGFDFHIPIILLVQGNNCTSIAAKSRYLLEAAVCPANQHSRAVAIDGVPFGGHVPAPVILAHELRVCDFGSREGLAIRRDVSRRGEGERK